MSSTCSLTVSLYILAVPWKLPTMVDGMPMRTRASSMAACACERDAPSARLKDRVTAANWP